MYKKRVVRLNESGLHRIVRQSVKKVLRESSKDCEMSHDYDRYGNRSQYAKDEDDWYDRMHFKSSQAMNALSKDKKLRKYGRSNDWKSKKMDEAVRRAVRSALLKEMEDDDYDNGCLEVAKQKYARYLRNIQGSDDAVYYWVIEGENGSDIYSDRCFPDEDSAADDCSSKMERNGISTEAYVMSLGYIDGELVTDTMLAFDPDYDMWMD